MTISATLERVPTPTRTTFYDPGNFARGDRIRMTDESMSALIVGEEGVVIRVDKDDTEDGPEIFPVIVWLDVWGKPSGPEFNGELGLPVCAVEIEKVEK